MGRFIAWSICDDDEHDLGTESYAVASSLPSIVRTNFEGVLCRLLANLVLDDDPIVQDEVSFSTSHLGALGDSSPSGE